MILSPAKQPVSIMVSIVISIIWWGRSKMFTIHNYTQVIAGTLNPAVADHKYVDL